MATEIAAYRRQYYIQHVNSEVTGTNYRGRICLLCGKQISSKKYKGRVFQIEAGHRYYNGYSNTKYVCWSCLKKHATTRYKALDDSIAIHKVRLQQLNEEKTLFERLLNLNVPISDSELADLSLGFSVDDK